MAVKFSSGSFNYLSTPTASNIHPTIGNMTMLGWVKPTAANLPSILSLNDGSTFFTLGVDSATKIALKSGTWAGTTRLQTSGTVSAGTWYFLAITRTSGTYEMYLGTEGGAVSSQGTVAGWASGNEWPVTSSRISFFGERGSDSGSANTELSRWRIWESALNSSEVEAERLRLTPLKAGVWADYRFTAEASKSTATVGTNLSDVSGTYTDGTEPTGLSDGASGVNKAAAYYAMLGS